MNTWRMLSGVSRSGSGSSRTVAPRGKKSGCWRTSRSDRRDSRDLRMLRVRERTICVSLPTAMSMMMMMIKKNDDDDDDDDDDAI